MPSPDGGQSFASSDGLNRDPAWLRIAAERPHTRPEPPRSHPPSREMSECAVRRLCSGRPKVPPAMPEMGGGLAGKPAALLALGTGLPEFPPDITETNRRRPG